MSDQGDLFYGKYTLGETRDTDDLWTSAGFGGPSIADFLGISSPYRVTGREALEQAAALICLDVLSQDISKATLRLKKKVRGGFKTVDPKEHPIATMLALDPNPRHTWIEFVAMFVFHLAMASNSYAYVERNQQNDPLALIPIMPGRVQDRINPKSRETFYDIFAGTEQEAALLGFNSMIAPERNVVHVRQRMLDGFYGYSTLLAGGRSLMLGRKIEDYERKLFSDQAMIRGVFSRPADKQPLTDEAFRRVKSQLKKLLARVVDENDPILLEDGITYKEIAMTADEANMGKALDSQIEMVCKLWRMPPHKAMHLTAVKYENLSTMEMVYVRDTLMPICRLIETRLGRTLLTPEERLNFSFEFDRDELSISDQTQETARIKMMAERGIISINEAREDQGYNPRPGGDVYILPVNTVLVDENGNVVATGTKSSANTDGEPPADDGEDTAPPKKSLRLVANN